MPVGNISHSGKKVGNVSAGTGERFTVIRGTAGCVFSL